MIYMYISVQRETSLYCSDGVHPGIVLEKVRNLIFEPLDHFVDALLPRRFEILALLNGDEEFS